MKSPIQLLAAAMLLVSASVAFAQNTINESFDGIESIDIVISSGDITFEKSPDGKVAVEMSSSYDEYEPTIEKRGTRLIIDEDKMKNRRSWSGDVSWTLKIPDNTRIDHNTGSGDVKVTGLQLDVKMNSGSGNFRFANTGGSIDINTGSGNIEVTSASGKMEFNCGSGDIDLQEVKAEVSVNVGSGDIEAAGLTLTGASSFNSGSGDVQVELAEALAHDISLNSGSGDATLDFNGKKIEGLITMEASKDNGKIEAPFDFDSTEEINRGNSTTVRKIKKLGNADVKIKVGTGSGTAEIKAE